MGTRHTQFFMDKEYPNIPMGGGSGGGGSFDVTDLFVNEQHSDLTQITLSESIENYDLIEFIVEDRTYQNYTSFVYDSEWMVNNVPYVSDNPTGTFPQLFMLGYDNHYMRATMGQTNDKLIIPTDKNTLMIYAVRGLKCGSGGGGGSSSGINYSLDEQVIGTWVDGKPLYQKTLYYSDFQGGTFEVDIENAEMGFITEGFLIQAGASNKAVFLLNGWLYDTGHVGLYGYIDDICRSDTHKMRLNVYKTQWNGEVYLTIRYTKTTD